MKNQIKTKNPSLSTISYKLSTARGFTIVETLVALSILSFSIMGIIVATSQGINNMNLAKNKLTASYFAQEGIELMRNLRDTRTLDTTGWANFLTEINVCDVDNSCNINREDLIVSTCGLGCPVGQNFRRSIVVENVTNTNDEIKVTVTVYWNQGAAPKFVTVTANLFNH